MRQIPLQFPVSSSYHSDDFLVSDCNEEAWMRIQSWPDWPQPALLLRGAPSSGKTHLANMWAAMHQAAVMNAVDIHIDDDPQHYSTQHECFVIENIEQIRDEQSLFHLLNFQRESSVKLLLSVDDEACWSRFKLPDLRSRLQALPQVMIHAPDELLLRALLVKLFADHQRTVEPNLLDYLLPRIERSFAGVAQVVKLLEQQAAVKKVPITVYLARSVLTEC